MRFLSFRKDRKSYHSKIGTRRKYLTKIQTQILASIWANYEENGHWPRRSKIQVQFGSPRDVEKGLRDLGSGILRDSSSSPFEVYILGIMGVILIPDGEKIFDLIAAFLRFLRKLINENGSVEFAIPKDIILSELGINDSDFIKLVRAMDTTSCKWGGFVDGNAEWSFKPCDEAVELIDVEEGSICEYLWDAILQSSMEAANPIYEKTDYENPTTGPNHQPKRDLGERIKESVGGFYPRTNQAIILYSLVITILTYFLPQIKSNIGNTNTVFFAIIGIGAIVILFIYLSERRRKESGRRLRITIPVIVILAISAVVVSFKYVKFEKSAEEEIPASESSRIPETMEFVKIQGGSYQMGSHDKGIDHNQSVVSRPILQMHDFEIMNTEVTQGMWLEIMGTTLVEHNAANPHSTGRIGVIGDSIPMHLVSWEDCQEFMVALNQLDTMYVYRLPSEAEWEYVSRYDVTYSGDMDAWSSIMDDLAWSYSGASVADGPMRVAQKQPNDYELYDMYGNVWEWCQDYYHEDYTGIPTDGSPWIDQGQSNPERCIRRGGGYRSNYECTCTSTYRSSRSPSVRYSTLGFRVVRMPIEDLHSSF